MKHWIIVIVAVMLFSLLSLFYFGLQDGMDTDKRN